MSPLLLYTTAPTVTQNFVGTLCCTVDLLNVAVAWGEGEL